MAILPRKTGGARIGSGRKAGKYDTLYSQDGRVCTKCAVWRPWSDYIPKSKRLGVYWPRCKHCAKVYREQNKNHIAQWRQENKEKMRANSNNYRTAKVGNGGKFSAHEWRLLCDRFGSICIACGNKTRLTADHIVPVSKGGSSHISNIQPLCQSCNSRKGAHIIDYRGLHHLASSLNELESLIS